MNAALLVAVAAVVVLLLYLAFMYGAGKSYRAGLAGDAVLLPVRQDGLRRFIVRRHEDVSGVSGKGVVCEGVEFSDGHVAVHWVGSKYPWTTPIPEGVDGFLDVHGHGGRTVVEWVDDA